MRKFEGKYEKEKYWKEIAVEKSGKIGMRKVVDRGLELTTRKREPTKSTRKKVTTRKLDVVQSDTLELNRKIFVTVDRKINLDVTDVKKKLEDQPIKLEVKNLNLKS